MATKKKAKPKTESQTVSNPVFSVSLGLYQFEDDVLFDAVNHRTIDDISTINFLATKSIETWWDNRRLDIAGQTIDITDAFILQQLLLAVTFDRDAQLVDYQDITFVVPFDEARDFAQTVMAEVERTMRYWDNFQAITVSGLIPEIVAALKTLWNENLFLFAIEETTIE